MANEATTTFSRSLRIALRPSTVGLVLATVAILFGQLLGIVFGLNEDIIKGHLQASATEVSESIYKNDEAAMKAVQSKAWNYMLRAHLHAGAMGTTALAMIVVVSLLGVSWRVTCAISVALGGGGLGYSIFWMWAGFRAPGLGSTGAAKESLSWLAIPSSGAFVVGTLAALVVLVAALVKASDSDTSSH